MCSWEIKLKYFILHHYFLIIIIVLLISVFVLVILLWSQIYDFGVIFTIVGGLVSFFYFVQKQQLEELNTFRELFIDFNARFDKLNKELNRIVSEDSTEDLKETEKNTLYDYFNLCSEEYLFYRKGYIYPEVWKEWCKGIQYYLDNKRIGNLWSVEEKNDYYYGLTYKKIRACSGQN